MLPARICAISSGATVMLSPQAAVMTTPGASPVSPLRFHEYYRSHQQPGSPQKVTKLLQSPENGDRNYLSKYSMILNVSIPRKNVKIRFG